MKYALLVWLLIPVSGCNLLTRDTHNTSSFLIAGQSNGTSGIQGTQGPIASVTGHVTIHDVAGFSGIPTETRPSSVSITWVYLGDMLTGALVSDVQFVNISRGNTSTDQWIQNGWYKDIGPKARSSKATAVLWVQGESDGLQNLGVEQTYQNMKQMILDSRQYVPDLKWYVALDSYQSDNPHVAQQRLISEGLAFKGPDIDLMRIDEPTWFEGSKAEFSNIEGFKGHAQAWFDILKQDQRWRY